MKENTQQEYYKILGQELTKARERKKMSTYDLAKFVGEQWTTINKMEAGGKFMAHHFVWMRAIGVNLNILVDDTISRLNALPEVQEESQVEQAKETTKKGKGKRDAKKQYAALTEEPEVDEDHYGGNDTTTEDLSSLF